MDRFLGYFRRRELDGRAGPCQRHRPSGAFAHPSPPTANGAGFIDELHLLFVPPPACQTTGAQIGLRTGQRRLTSKSATTRRTTLRPASRRRPVRPVLG